jgi:DNA polymerase-3 subunit delta'
MTKKSPIIGHEAAQAQLIELVQQQKLPHAILLSGPKGIGKAAFAETLARCLLTEAFSGEPEEAGLFGDALPQEAPQRFQYEADHPAIARIEAGAHGNLKWVEPLRDEKKKMSFTTIAIEQIREVVEFMRLSTSEVGWRIVMIDPAEGMNHNAENALLKVLEEPPNQTLLLLITSQPDRLLPTTRSRCREIKLQPLTESQVLEVLAEQGAKITDQEKLWLTQLAPLSAGQWQRYLEHQADTLYEQWLEVFVMPETKQIQSFTTSMAKLDTAAWQLACDLGVSLLHRLVLSYYQPLSLLPSEQEQFPQLKNRCTAEEWQSLWQQMVEWLPKTTASNYDKKQVLQSLLFQAPKRPMVA